MLISLLVFAGAGEQPRAVRAGQPWRQPSTITLAIEQVAAGELARNQAARRPIAPTSAGHGIAGRAPADAAARVR